MSQEKYYQKAVILGGSMAGLLAARILAVYFEEVIIIEKDILPTRPEARRSVPQGNHPHIILAKGLEWLEVWFPGITQEMQAAGAQVADTAKDVSWFFGYRWMPRFDSGIKGLISLRPYLEWQVRRRLLRAYPNVRILENYLTEGFLRNDTNTCITGVKCKRADGIQENMYATLTVDATGRGSQTPGWLKIIGYPTPRETEVEMHLGYTSRIYKRPVNFNGDWKSHAVYADFPHVWRGGGITNVQDDQWMVTLTGYFGDHSPANDSGFLEFARSLAKPYVYQWLKDETPIVNSKVYKIPKIRRRYYEELSSFPDGLIVIGDAVCVFNPIFAQGITVIALCAAALDKCLVNQIKMKTGDIQGLSRNVQKKIAKSLNTPWHLTNAINFSYPQTKGRRPLLTPVNTWILKRTIETCSENTGASQIFLEVMHMKAPPSIFCKPSFLLPLLLHAIKYVFNPLSKR